MNWLQVFWVEIPLMLGTVLYWVLFPSSYLESVFLISEPGPGEILLLRLWASATLSLAIYYAFLLSGKLGPGPLSLVAFQLGLLAGDFLIVVLCAPYAGGNFLMGIQVAMAAVWGGVRLVFLYRYRNYILTRV